MPKKIIFYVVALLLLGANVWLGGQTYYFFTHSQEQIVNQYILENPNIYKPLIFKKFYFTPDAYRQSIVFSSIGLLICLGLNFFYWRHRSFLQHLYGEFLEVGLFHVRQIKGLFLSFSLRQIIVLCITLGSVLGHQVYMYQHIFVAIDEVFSWLFFASQGVFVSVSNYPVPNNHIFYNLCSIFWSNFIEDQILAMRLTSLLSFWLLLLLIFYYFLKITNFQTALLALMLFGLGFSQSVFAVQGRGYMLLTLCFFVALWSLQAYLQSYTNAYLALFVIACVIGFWTIPVFLYILVSFYVYLLWWALKHQQKLIFLKFLRIGVLIGFLVYLCYCPVLMYSGFQALAGNENVSPKNYDSAWFFGYILSIAMRESIIYVISLPKYISFVVFVVLGIVLWIVARKTTNVNLKFLWEFLLVSLPTTFAIICLMRAFPFYRVWTYYAVFLAVLIAWLAYHFIFSKKRVSDFGLVAFNVLLAGGAYFQFEREIQDFYDPKAYQYHKQLEQKSQEIIAKEQSVYLSIEAFYVRFWIEHAQKNALMRANSCETEVAVTEIPEPTPPCQEKDEDIWFLRFYHKQENLQKP